MPIAKLFVEGTLDVEVLNPLLTGMPVLQPGGSKNSLKPRAAAERRENRVSAGYLRDRDFDFDPPLDLSTPTVDAVMDNVPFGWRWCRHEIENYLIEPTLVSEAIAVDLVQFIEELRHVAGQIRYYEAARWTIGQVRRALPPHYELRTRPDSLSEFGLPQELDRASIGDWALSNIAAHQVRIAIATERTAVRTSFDTFIDRFDDEFTGSQGHVLLWFSGKDLLAGLTDWLRHQGFQGPGEVRGLLRDWIIANPDRTLELLPEWRGMIDAVRQ